jgi:hypothetical protein
MAVLLVLMMAVFSLVGVCLLFIFTRELVRKLVRLPYLERAEGTVTAITANQANFHGDSAVNTTMHFPVITFLQHGVTQSFTSEVGDGEDTRYFIGQKIAVRYDPTGAIPPTIDSWFAMWLRPAIGIFSGFVFLGGTALVYVAFGDRIFVW